MAIVQVKLVMGGTSTSVAATLTGTQTAGNTNVVLLGWGAATGTVTGLTDTLGNTYVPVITTQGNGNSITTWISTGGIAAGSNTVTATFSTSTVHDIIVAEYPGILVSDGSSGAFATSNAPNSGSITTTNASDVLIGSLWMRGGAFSAVEPGWTLQSGTSATVIVLEDRNVTSTGTYAATATMGASTAWVAQIVALLQTASVTLPNAASSATSAVTTLRAFESLQNSSSSSTSATTTQRLKANIHNAASSVTSGVTNLRARARLINPASSLTVSTATLRKVIRTGSIALSLSSAAQTLRIFVRIHSQALTISSAISLTRIVRPVPPPKPVVFRVASLNDIASSGSSPKVVVTNSLEVIAGT